MEKKKTETWNDYVLRMIDSRKDNYLDYDELYEILYDDRVSNTEARKRLYGVKTHIIAEGENKSKLPDDYLSKESFELKSDGSHELTKFVQNSEEELKDTDRILEILGYDKLSWEVTSSRHNRWNVYSKKDGKQVMYSLKANVKPRKIMITTDKIKDVIKSLKLDLNDVQDYNHSDDGEYMLEIPLMDTHFNKQIDERIAGYSLNVEKTREIYLETVKYFLDKAKSLDLKKIVFPIGQDYFNSEATNSTTSGTPQSNELPHDLMFKKGVDLLFQAIEMCRAVAPVEVTYVAGNHDEHIGFYAISTLERAYEFAGKADITFDTLIKRKYIRFGKSLIGYTHGNKERKRIEKYNIMQNERAKDWGETLYHEWHMGHLHSEHVEEVGGIKYRKLNSITGTDKWHYNSGFIGALRMAQAFLWHSEYGLLDIYNKPVTE